MAALDNIISQPPEFRYPEPDFIRNWGELEGPSRKRSKVLQTDFQDWLKVWRLDFSSENLNNRDLVQFTDSMKNKVADVITVEVRNLKAIKVSFGLKVNFKRDVVNEDREMETRKQRHYFKEDPRVIDRVNTLQKIDRAFDEFIDTAKGEVENCLQRCSGWEIDGITILYINVARYQPLRGDTYIPTPPSLPARKR